MTKLTTKEIENAIVFGWLGGFTENIVIPHLALGLLNHEADIAIISKAGYLTEIEIKRSLDDLKKDFFKKVFHCDERVSKFYFCLPISIKAGAFKLFNQHRTQICRLLGTEEYRHPAILFFDEAGNISSVGDARTNGRQLTVEERCKAMRIMTIRYWDLRRRNNG